MPRPDPAEGLSTTSIAMNTLKSQNLSLANRITALKREKADLSQHKNEFERKNLALETNVAVLKQYWVKHLNELKATRQLQKPFNDKKLEQEFEECLSLAMSALDTLTFQQSQEEFQEKVAQMFTAEGKVYKDIITGSQRVIEAAIERVTIEIEQCRLSTEEGVSSLTGFQQKLQELSDSVDQVRDSRTKIDQNNFLTQIAEMKKKVEKLEEDLADVKEYNEVLDRRFKIALRGFIQIDEETEKEQECNDIIIIIDQIAK